MKAIYLKLPDELLETSGECAQALHVAPGYAVAADHLLETSGECAQALHVSRAEYIRSAIERMNRETRARLRAQRLAEVSRRVRAESMRVNAEFAAIETVPDPE